MSPRGCEPGEPRGSPAPIVVSDTDYVLQGRAQNGCCVTTDWSQDSVVWPAWLERIPQEQCCGRSG